MEIKTRIRVYSLQERGLSISYTTEDGLIVVGGRYDNKNIVGIHDEMDAIGAKYIRTLIIPSWDPFYCKSGELKAMIEDLQPDSIFFPEIQPNNEGEMKSLTAVMEYKEKEYCVIPSKENFLDENRFFVREIQSLTYGYINQGDISLMFYTQCNNEVCKNNLLNDFQSKQVDVLVVGKGFLDDTYSAEIVSKIGPSTIVGRLSSHNYTVDNLNTDAKKTLHVSKDDIFISKVDNKLVHLALGNIKTEIL